MHNEIFNTLSLKRRCRQLLHPYSPISNWIEIVTWGQSTVFLLVHYFDIHSLIVHYIEHNTRMTCMASHML